MILLDEGTTSNTSAYDIERRPPPVNEAYALDRRERDRIYAQMGYSESEAMLASDLGVPSDVGAPEKRVPPPLMSGRELWRVEEGEWEREQERTVRKVAPRAQLRSPAPKRWVGLSGQDVTERSASRGRSQSAGRNTHLTPARALDRDSSDRRGRSRSNTADTARTLMPHNGFLQADQPQTEPRGVSTHDDLPHEESLDSSNFSQVDLGASSASADTYVSTEISDDPWREEVLENRRRGR
ncbi:MAG: hypothetical protein M1830_008711 [Pleopsidium flavum]|nr:MAG: hypothetical protein M1830_008711 [Pleopsidium flavum]